MTDILEPIKAKILRFPSQAIMFTLEEVKPLITTIESQKEEIEKYRREAMNERELGESIVAEREQLYIEIESLKAITELAVKGLKEISDGGSTGEDARDMRITADYALSEIERLSHELDK